METEKLYYADPFLKEFTATVLDCQAGKNGYTVTLDRTAFYPEGGGQPAEQKNARRQHQTGKAEPVQQPGSLLVLKQRRLFFHESILFSENYGSYTSVQPSP